MTLRDLIAAIALTVGVVGAVSAWMEQPGSIAVAPGRSDAGLYAVVERFRLSHESASNGLRALFARPRVSMTQSEFDALAPHITNVHVIPASPAIYDELRNMRHGELVTLRGKLVNVRDRDGTLALTSTTPGDRDCEILWLEHVRRGRL
jgi:hypothetical protein